MRFALVLAAVIGVLFAAGIQAPGTFDSRFVAAQEQQSQERQAPQPGGELTVEVEIAQERGAAWWTSPVWIAIGGIALVLLVVIIVLAARGGGTTIVKD